MSEGIDENKLYSEIKECYKQIRHFRTLAESSTFQQARANLGIDEAELKLR